MSLDGPSATHGAVAHAPLHGPVHVLMRPALMHGPVHLVALHGMQTSCCFVWLPPPCACMTAFHTCFYTYVVVHSVDSKHISEPNCTPALTLRLHESLPHILRLPSQPTAPQQRRQGSTCIQEGGIPARNAMSCGMQDFLIRISRHERMTMILHLRDTHPDTREWGEL